MLLLALVSFTLSGVGAGSIAGAEDRRAAAALSAPIVGAAHAVSAPVQTSAAGAQSNPAVAWDGTNFLVVWDDGRGGDPRAGDIFGARVSPSGTLLDPTGFLISPLAGDQRAPAVAWNGTNFLVVWQEPRPKSGDGIVGARVSPAGTVLDPAGIPISTTDTVVAPSVASNGSNFLVAFQANVGGATSIRAARVNNAGAVLDNPAINVSSAPNGRGEPAVASNGATYFVVWSDTRADPSDIYGARVSAAGNVGDPNGIPLTSASGAQGGPSIAWNGSTYLTAWSDGDITATRVSSTGTVLDSAGIPISTAVGLQNAPAVGALGSEFFVAWDDFDSSTSSQSDIVGAGVRGNGTVIDANGIAISGPPPGQFVPAVAGGNTNLLVSWQGITKAFAVPDILAARVAGGSVTGPRGFLVSGAADNQTAPAVAFDGTNFLVVWGNVLGARVSPTGSRLDGPGFHIGGGVAPAVAWNGHEYLVVWEQERANSITIFGARVTKTGRVVDVDGFRIGAGDDDQQAPAVTWNGENFLVVWQDVVDHETRDWNVVGARVTAGGTVLDPNGITISDDGHAAVPKLASNGTVSLVVWEERNIAPGGIRGARVTNGGHVLDA
ncbi:MAG: hypothetical protein QOI55_449, partial [Actinomycetota bacterium]|nr:hypothetical protein [Actinomycetota bacterium]